MVNKNIYKSCTPVKYNVNCTYIKVDDKYPFKQKLHPLLEKKLFDMIERLKKINWVCPRISITKTDKLNLEKNVIDYMKVHGLIVPVLFKLLDTQKKWNDMFHKGHDINSHTYLLPPRPKYAFDVSKMNGTLAAYNAMHDHASSITYFICKIGSSDVYDFCVKVLQETLTNVNDYTNLLPLWEAGLYPYGYQDKKFLVVYRDKLVLPINK